eukprot:TRINITY_DN15434_c0_g1_i1.p1 TRINITY_DN15434_c0_g1~~TRINITY_DN15434_c0_g1_i1.p1  ORF type:complete len:196 (-),score=80.94 TRINITY_DN15434_c0_g1_i1:215-733(-)
MTSVLPLPSSMDSRKPATLADSASTMRRLQSELMSLMTAPPPGVSAFPNGGNFFNWNASINGVSSTPYADQQYKLTLEFPSEYPFKAPVVKFTTPIFHPNVDTSGNICLDILKDKWSAVYNVSSVLLSIQSLLGEPNVDSPLNGVAAGLWANQEEYRRVVAQQYAEARDRAI